MCGTIHIYVYVFVDTQRKPRAQKGLTVCPPLCASLLGPTKFGCTTRGFLTTRSFMDFVRKQEITVLIERFPTPYGLHRKNLVFQGQRCAALVLS